MRAKQDLFLLVKYLVYFLIIALWLVVSLLASAVKFCLRKYDDKYFFKKMKR